MVRVHCAGFRVELDEESPVLNILHMDLRNRAYIWFGMRQSDTWPRILEP